MEIGSVGYDYDVYSPVQMPQADTKREQADIKASDIRQAAVVIKQSATVVGKQSAEYSEYEDAPVEKISAYTKENNEILEKAIASANKWLYDMNRQVRCSIHPKTKDIMIKIIDAETKQVIRELPPEKSLDAIAKMWELAGLFVDERK